MSYARFGADGSDVYVISHAGGLYCCYWCALNEPDESGFPPNWTSPKAEAMAAHLREHIGAGHTVPGDAIEEILADGDIAVGEQP